MKRKQRGVYLTGPAEVALERIAAESGKHKSDIVSDALVFFADWPGEIRRIIREELDR
mgnify:CR=1 FL=1